jgi:hypothetical protein
VCESRSRQTQSSSRVAAFGVIFALGALSFHHARPRGHSDIEFQEQDAWTAGDMLRCLTIVGGRISFYADYVCGRMMKT